MRVSAAKAEKVRSHNYFVHVCGLIKLISIASILNFYAGISYVALLITKPPCYIKSWAGTLLFAA